MILLLTFLLREISFPNFQYEIFENSYDKLSNNKFKYKNFDITLISLNLGFETHDMWYMKIVDAFYVCCEIKFA